jgi:predicted transposase/invertase (TIGR01784 family)
MNKGTELLEGQPYSQLKRCVTINILNYSFLPNKLYHNVFHLREDRTGIELIDDIEVQSKWEVLTMKEPVLRKAMDTLEFLSQDADARRLYEARQKYLHDEASMIEGARAEGKAQGKAEGKAEGKTEGKMEMARRLLSLGIELPVIAEASGLSVEVIKSLK